MFVTEGSPIQSVTDLEGFTFFNQSTGAATPLRSSVPIYPIDPRGLTSLADQSIEVGALAGFEVPPDAALRDEIAASRERMHALALDTGGFVIANNNVDAGLDRIARLTGSYYSIGYYAKKCTARRQVPSNRRQGEPARRPRHRPSRVPVKPRDRRAKHQQTGQSRTVAA